MTTQSGQTAAAEKRGIHEIVDANFDEQLAATREVLRRRSVLDEQAATTAHPFGKELSDALDDFLARAEGLGFKTKNLDNYAGYAQMGDTGELIGILAHLDVVPEGRESDWRHPPYSATMEDGRLHGRGSIDDKGPAVAALYAMKALRDSGATLKKRFRLILGLDEESGSRCILHYNEREEQPSFSFSPDAEFPVVNAEKGILRATLTWPAPVRTEASTPHIARLAGGDRFNVVPDLAKAEIICTPDDAAVIAAAAGRSSGVRVQETERGVSLCADGAPAHAMEPQKGENAVQKLLGVLTQIPLASDDAHHVRAIRALVGSGFDGGGLGIIAADEVSGHLTCNLAALDSSDTATVAKLDIRYPVSADPEAILAAIEEAATSAGAELSVKAHKKPLYLPEENQTVQILLDAYEAITGDRPKPVSMGGGTYCRFMPNAVSAGPLFPGEPELAHQANESVSLSSLRRSTHIYAEALERFNRL